MQRASMWPERALLACKDSRECVVFGNEDLTCPRGFIGFPSVGKSTLMSRLTGQHSEGRVLSGMKD